MISYEVTLQVEAALGRSVEEFMRQSHIPAIYATGCFREIWFSFASPGRFRTSYVAAGQADLDRYLSAHAADFRADFLKRFPDGVSVSRETWVQREMWPPYHS